MAARSTHVSAEVRRDLIVSLLSHEKREGFRDMDHLLSWFLSLVGDGYFPEEADEDTVLACHSAVVTIQVMILRARQKGLSVRQSVRLLQTALPIPV